MPQNIFSSIDPETGALTYRQDIREAKVGETVSMCPGIYGGHNWQSMAFASRQQRLILPLHQLCGEMTGRSVERQVGAGGLRRRLQECADARGQQPAGQACRH